MTTLEQFIEIPEVRVVPKPKIIVDGEPMINPKRIDPFTAPTFEKFQAAFRSKYLRMPRGCEINRWDEEHPGEFQKRHPETRRGKR